MSNTQTAILAGGCFWCTDAVFQNVVGISLVESGYIGGETPDPTYEQVCTGGTGHAEAIRISFDPSVISYGQILDIFMATHDPTQLNRQGNDIGTQYRSALFPLDESQQEEAAAALARTSAKLGKQVATTIEPATKWYDAEPYHQNFWERMGSRNPYCMAVIPPKLQKLHKGFAQMVKA